MPTLSTVSFARASWRAACALAALALCAALGASTAAAHGSARNADRDRDGLSDRHERGRFHTDPRRWDSDGDGLGDGYEVRVSKTNPRRADTDRDGLSDGDEVKKYKTNPRRADSDGDGISDGAEVRAGTDPLNPASPGSGTPGGGGTTPPPGGGGGTPPPGGGTPPTGGGTPPTDGTAPQTTLLTGTTGAQSATSATFTFSADEAATFACRLDGGAYVPCTSPKTYTGLADGAHTFDVRATDTAGNVDATPASAAWTVDATAPVTTITAAPSGTTTATTAQVAFSSDEADSTFQCRLDTGAWASCTSPAALTGLAFGAHTFQVRATDAVGNTDATPAEATWTVEQLVPDTTITGGPSGVVMEFSASFTFTSPDPGVTYECRLNGDAWTACTSPMFYPDLLPGDQLFEVRAKTLAGGVVDPTPATRTWTVQDPGGGIS